MSYKFIYSLNKIDEISQLIIDKIKTVKTIMLRGELGSGKTTLVKSVLKRMGVNDSVTSPTFSIVNEYDFAGNMSNMLEKNTFKRLVAYLCINGGWG